MVVFLLLPIVQNKHTVRQFHKEEAYSHIWRSGILNVEMTTTEPIDWRTDKRQEAGRQRQTFKTQSNVPSPESSPYVSFYTLPSLSLLMILMARNDKFVKVDCDI